MDEEKINGNCEGNYTLIRTWTAEDACGNTTAKTQTITVVDEEAPIFTQTPSDITVSCDQVPDGDGQVVAMDLCNSPVLYSWDDEIVTGTCIGSIHHQPDLPSG